MENTTEKDYMLTE
ncbi:hypothetical protein BIW11_03316 [Tropilaelaps mercedesae]|uniref:Uncharacterized protein n=1 Tax=Tropilaelaps mercedesae TaxID=418985 RepID=A0A1V9XNJ8_9ACAR|nr:hypothetical protein BIW11_03316 [Tropilaelaps mercedesae]